MVALAIRCRQPDKDTILTQMWEAGTLGVTEKDEPGDWIELTAFFEERVDLPGEWREVEEGPLPEWEPLLVGVSFFLVPAWRNDPTPPGRFRLNARAAQASGSGYHPPTRLALRGLELSVRPGDTFLDVGTGSGILVEGAVLLGAGRVFGCDMDDAALQEARENGVVDVWQGSVRSVRTASVDLVAANLNAESLLSLRGDLLRVPRPGGRLILAGFERRHLAILRRNFPGPPLAILDEANWQALVLHV